MMCDLNQLVIREPTIMLREPQRFCRTNRFHAMPATTYTRRPRRASSFLVLTALSKLGSPAQEREGHGFQPCRLKRRLINRDEGAVLNRDLPNQSLNPTGNAGVTA